MNAQDTTRHKSVQGAVVPKKSKRSPGELRRRAKWRQKRLHKVRPKCMECGSTEFSIATGAEIYPHLPKLKKEAFYRCSCGAYVGCHPRTTIALGHPAGLETQAARQAAYLSFSALWQRKAADENIGRGYARSLGYKWLSMAMGIPPAECHIGMMDEATALRVAAICDRQIALVSQP